MTDMVPPPPFSLGLENHDKQRTGRTGSCRPSDDAILYVRILRVTFPRSVSNQFHNTWHLQPFGKPFPNDCKCFFYVFYTRKKRTGTPCA